MSKLLQLSAFIFCAVALAQPANADPAYTRPILPSIRTIQEAPPPEPLSRPYLRVLEPPALRFAQARPVADRGDLFLLDPPENKDSADDDAEANASPSDSGNTPESQESGQSILPLKSEDPSSPTSLPSVSQPPETILPEDVIRVFEASSKAAQTSARGPVIEVPFEPGG